MAAIKIYLDTINEKTVGLIEGKKLIKEHKGFNTYCTHFFQFKYLSHCSDVIVFNNNLQFSLKEVLDNEGYCDFTDQFLRHPHNMEKLLISGHFGDGDNYLEKKYKKEK